MKKEYKIIPSPNFNFRMGKKISMLILHYTASSFASTKATFLTPNSVSAHYVVDVDGRVYQFVDEADRAWHAGVSKFNAIANVNSDSLGIEIVNLGYHKDKTLQRPNYFPQIQINATIELCKDILSRYDILPFCIQGHSDIACERKIDPGPYFPWKELAQNDIGLYPTAEQIESIDPNTVDVQRCLSSYGYDIQNLDALKRAFQLHYNADAWLKKAPFSDYDKQILQALLNIKR